MFILFIKKLLFFTIIIFVAYLALENITLNLNGIIDAFFKSLIMSLLIVPISLIKYFPKSIAEKAKYNQSIEINLEQQKCFKQARMILKSMNDIKLIESLEFIEIKLESDFSYLYLYFNKLDDKTKIEMTSIPKVYKYINDFNTYQKDVKNIIMSLYNNLEKEDDYNQYLKETKTKCIEEFKPNIILYYRLVKVLLVSIFTFGLFLFIYYMVIIAIPHFSVVFFFALIALYILFVVLDDIDSITKRLICPICHTKLIKNKLLFKQYIMPPYCKNCGENFFPNNV